MKIRISDLPSLVAANPSLKTGCIIDTNALFAASMPLDRLNEWAEEVFETLLALNIPAFTNINIRSEFTDLQRRVLIPEGLVSLYDSIDRDTLSTHLRTQLKSLKTQKDEAALAGRLIKFNDQQIKKYRALLTEESHSQGMSSWESFCLTYLSPYICNLWDETISELNITSLGTRSIELKEYFNRDPDWAEMEQIIGRSGVGSADAMIINLFLCSKFPLIVSGDEDVLQAVTSQATDKKYVLCPIRPPRAES